MGWRDKFWSAYGLVVDTAIDVTTDATHAVGSLACMVGGAGFSISFALDETLNATYYGQAYTTGVVTADASLDASGFRVMETIPFDHYYQMNGVVTDNLTNYIHPDKVRAVSAILMSSGTALRLLSTSLKQWRQGNVDKFYYKSHHGVEIDGPSIKEYRYARAESVFGSLSLTCLSTATTGIVIDSLRCIGSSQRFTFPSKGESQLNSSYYPGPFKSLSIPLEYSYGKNISVEFFGMQIKALLEEKVAALANVTYGGELLFQPSTSSSPPVAISAIIGASAYLVSNFFAKKVKKERDERIIQAGGELSTYMTA